jgi:hypothetical protein
VGNLSLLQPQSSEEKIKAYLIRRQWILLTKQIADNPTPQQRAQIILNELPNRSKLRGITSLRLSHFVVRLHSTAPVRKLFLRIAASCGVCIPQN